MWAMRALTLLTLLAATECAPREMCGQVQCLADEYCSTETNQCMKCQKVCDKTHHNYEAKICEDRCSMPPDVSLESIQMQARIALILSCVALAILLILVVFLVRKSICKKHTWKSCYEKYLPTKKRVNHMPVDLMHTNPHAVSPRSRPTLQLGINSGPATLEPATIETLSAKNLAGGTNPNAKNLVASANRNPGLNKPKRFPAEDTTLDNNCYDNAAMNVTPSPTSNETVVGRST